MNYKPSIKETLSEAALIKLRNIFNEDPIAYSRELNIISIALDEAKPLHSCDELKIVPQDNRQPVINQTIPL